MHPQMSALSATSVFRLRHFLPQIEAQRHRWKGISCSSLKNPVERAAARISPQSVPRYS
jgi:hypothetical protein